MGRNKCKPRIIPEQDKRICGGICLCQLTVVLSCVALIYLTVVIYMPSHKAFTSGYDTTPVMCHTVNITDKNNCSWTSCGEWCLTKASGFCPQIHVLVRHNGTQMRLVNCSHARVNACPPPSHDRLYKFNCNNGSECSTLSGLFNCSLGHCTNMSQVYQCHYRADGMQIDSEKDNVKLNGFFECHASRCTKIKHAFSCDRYCQTITTEEANVYVEYDDKIYAAKCSGAMAMSTATDTIVATTSEVEVWRAAPGQVLFVSCTWVSETNDGLRGIDCINGTIIAASEFPKPFINFTTFWNITQHNNRRELVDPNKQLLPPLETLIIYDNVKLFINLEGCVNTLQGECNKFIGTHGRDGRNQTAISRFTCFYNRNDSELAIARFDLEKTWKELIIAIVIPSVLFVISFITLCIITQSVRVDDDTKMRCKCCASAATPELLDEDQTNQTHVPESGGDSDDGDSSSGSAAHTGRSDTPENTPPKHNIKYAVTVQCEDGPIQQETSTS